MRLIAYVRVSSTGQLDGYGPESQLADMRKWAKAYKHKIVSVKTDDISGKVEADKRPALLETLEMLRKPPQADGMVVANLTRLARELHVQEAILAQVWAEEKHVFAADQGEILRNDPDDPMRTAMRQMQGVFAQLDRAMIAKRLRDGRRIKADSGRHANGVYAFGTQGVGEGRQRDAGPREDEQAAVTRITELRTAGESYRAIAAILDAEELKPRRSATWSAMSVRNVALRAGVSE
jgi:DNA invertase Pin-like site-specific DNA recombinase